MWRSALIWVAVLSACGGPAQEATPIADGASGRVLTVGSISLSPSREHGVIAAFAEALAGRLGWAGVGSGRALVTESVGAMAEAIRSGAVDVYIDSPFPAAFVARRTGAIPVLVRRKQGVTEYHSVIYVRRDSGLAGVADLRGRMVAFGEPFSTASYFLPKASLSAAGERLERFEDPAARVPADRIGYVLSGDAESSMVWVLKGKVDAGAINADYLTEMAGARADEIVVIHRSMPVPRNVVCLRADLEPDLAAAVTTTLLEMHLDQEGRMALRAFRETERFSALEEGSSGFEKLIGPMLAALDEDLGGD